MPLSLLHSTALYWTNFQILNLHPNTLIFKKNLTKSCSSLFHASFDTFCVQIDWLPYSFKGSMKSSFWPFWKQNGVCSIFCQVKSVNLDSKGVTWSVKSWTITKRLWKSGHYIAMEWTGFLFSGIQCNNIW